MRMGTGECRGAWSLPGRGVAGPPVVDAAASQDFWTSREMGLRGSWLGARVSEGSLLSPRGLEGDGGGDPARRSMGAWDKLQVPETGHPHPPAGDACQPGRTDLLGQRQGGCQQGEGLSRGAV